MISYTQKSISTLIATILLIVIAVALVTIILGWGKNFTQQNLSQSNIKYDKSDLMGYINLKYTLNPENIFITNLHPSESFTITSYKLISESKFNFIENYTFPIPEITINPNTTIQLNIACTPSKKFIIQLMSSNIVLHNSF